MARKLRVLMIDDDESICELTRRHLDDIDGTSFDFDSVGSADEGLDRLIHGDYDVYLVDFRLRSVDGLELVREAISRGCDAPIILLTAYGSRVLELKAMEAGAELFLEKDRMDSVLLERSIRLVMERHSLRRSLADRTKELERSNRELQQFAYVASHDLQEPLRMIAGYTSLLERRLGESLDENSKVFMGYVLEGVARMQRLIDDLLTYSRAGTQKPKPTLTSSASALERALQHLRPMIEEAGATIRRADLPAVVADSGKLTQVFQNLVGNALKFRNAKPPEIDIGASDEGDRWKLWVRDNGIGLDEKHRERIFVIFQRLHARDRYSGTGIGLAICKRIVEYHGGEIWVESRPGHGAAFYFTLPKTTAAGENAEHD